jgi:hypothetical protein
MFSLNKNYFSTKITENLRSIKNTNNNVIYILCYVLFRPDVVSFFEEKIHSTIAFIHDEVGKPAS